MQFCFRAWLTGMLQGISRTETAIGKLTFSTLMPTLNFLLHFLQRENVFWFNLYCNLSNWQRLSIGAIGGVVPKRLQNIICTWTWAKHDPYVRHRATLSYLVVHTQVNHCGQVTPYDDICQGWHWPIGLLSGDNKPLHEPMFTCHHRWSVEFT